MSNIFPEDKKLFDGQPGIKKVALICLAVISFVVADSLAQAGMAKIHEMGSANIFTYAIYIGIPTGVPLLAGFVCIAELFPDMPENPSR